MKVILDSVDYTRIAIAAVEDFHGTSSIVNNRICFVVSQAKASWSDDPSKTPNGLRGPSVDYTIEFDDKEIYIEFMLRYL